MSETHPRTESKFSGLLAAAKERTPEPTIAPVRAQPEEWQAERRQPGRPRGKRSDPRFEQVTAYIGKQTHRNVKIALLTEGEGREFSELVEQLLAEWLSLRG